ncbi:MAG: DivIVA domain-containing protein [Bacteroidota bacterium]|jgi:cell division initiation protein|nr:DivIVA domain-containing protein [Bacteroidota bacterium]MCA4899954.1 DivIVA domain-containing protein [Cytophagales bacterium]MCE2955626.1 DivIVA domain-containing protein [Flammeovirgaceae bacterium]MCZ8072008.1 DivIVA domain-containing protein [Cytophagales bacterium]
MKITPLEIRQKAFERVLRGYDKDEVNAYLQSLSQEWERTLDEVKEVRIKYEATEREVTKLREVESSLYKTLKTAEDTGANVIEQANKTAELVLREAQMKADAMLNEAKAKAKNTIEEAEFVSKQMLAEMEDRLKMLGQHYKTLELHKDNLLADMKRLAGETIDRVERAKAAAREFDPDQHLALAKRETKKALFPNAELEREIKSSMALPTEEPEQLKVEVKIQRSFFDDIQ